MIPPLEVPSILVITMPVKRRDFFEGLGLLDAILARRRIDDEERISWGAPGISFERTRLILPSSAMRLLLVLKTAGRIDDHEIDLVLFRVFGSIVGDRSGVAIGLA
jgi:hypothetical protein